MAKGFINANTKIYADDVLNPHIYNAKGLAEDKAEINRKKVNTGTIVSYTRNSESDSASWAPGNVSGCTTVLIYAKNASDLSTIKFVCGNGYTEIASGEYLVADWGGLSGLGSGKKALAIKVSIDNGIPSYQYGSSTSFANSVTPNSAVTNYSYQVSPLVNKHFIISQIPVGTTVSIYAC